MAAGWRGAGGRGGSRPHAACPGSPPPGGGLARHRPLAQLWQRLLPCSCAAPAAWTTAPPPRLPTHPPPPAHPPPPPLPSPLPPAIAAALRQQLQLQERHHDPQGVPRQPGGAGRAAPHHRGQRGGWVCMCVCVCVCVLGGRRFRAGRAAPAASSRTARWGGVHMHRGLFGCVETGARGRTVPARRDRPKNPFPMLPPC